MDNEIWTQSPNFKDLYFLIQKRLRSGILKVCNMNFQQSLFAFLSPELICIEFCRSLKIYGTIFLTLKWNKK